MKEIREKIRICSSGSNGREPDELDRLATAYIQRFCDTIETLLEHREEPPPANRPFA